MMLLCGFSVVSVKASWSPEYSYKVPSSGKWVNVDGSYYKAQKKATTSAYGGIKVTKNPFAFPIYGDFFYKNERLSNGYFRLSNGYVAEITILSGYRKVGTNFKARICSSDYEPNSGYVYARFNPDN